MTATTADAANEAANKSLLQSAWDTACDVYCFWHKYLMMPSMAFMGLGLAYQWMGEDISIAGAVAAFFAHPVTMAMDMVVPGTGTALMALGNGFETLNGFEFLADYVPDGWITGLQETGTELAAGFNAHAHGAAEAAFALTETQTGEFDSWIRSAYESGELGGIMSDASDIYGQTLPEYYESLMHLRHH